MPNNQPFQIRLTWEEPGSGEVQSCETGLPLTLGRGEDNTIILSGQRVSRHHARLELVDEQIMLFDEGSSNGTFVGGQRITRQTLVNGASFEITPFVLTLTLLNAPPDRTELFTPVADPPRTELVTPPADPTRTELFSPTSPGDTTIEGEITFEETEFDDIFKQPIISLSKLYPLGIPVDETTYLALGGGLGSFVWVDYLRISGVDLGLIKVIGAKSKPYERYRELCQASQIPDHERLRSDSGSTPDNIWGWPGYAVREAWHDIIHFKLGHAAMLLGTIFGEPTLATTYTPISTDVYASIETEARRIGWEHMWRFGRIQAIRKTDDGRYVVAYSQARDEHHPVKRLMVANYVHLAIGYPGVKYLPDLQRYREETRDFGRVVNAYDGHDHVYDHLAQHGGTVLVRGRGIVASRVMQRLAEIRQQNSRVAVLHLNRAPKPVGNRYGRAQRQVEHHWEFQPFNWPKAGWGGDLRVTLERANHAERAELFNEWGGSTTAARPDWRSIVETGLREHWYQIRFGEVTSVECREGKLITRLAGYGDFIENTELLVDYIIDATGLNGNIESHPLLSDMLEKYDLERNPLGRLQVANDFEVTGMRNETGSRHGRMYASGAMTLGGPYAPVDSFLGLQYSAFRAINSLVRLRSPGLRRLNPLRSTVGWCKWALGVQV